MIILFGIAAAVFIYGFLAYALARPSKHICSVCGESWRILNTAAYCGVHPDDVPKMIRCSAKHGGLFRFHQISRKYR